MRQRGGEIFPRVKTRQEAAEIDHQIANKEGIMMTVEIDRIAKKTTDPRK